MTADDVREEIRNAVVRAHLEYQGDPLIPHWSRHLTDAILPILTRREREAYQRGQADGWDEGYSDGLDYMSTEADNEPANPHCADENGDQG